MMMSEVKVSGMNQTSSKQALEKLQLKIPNVSSKMRRIRMIAKSPAPQHLPALSPAPKLNNLSILKKKTASSVIPRKFRFGNFQAVKNLVKKTSNKKR